MCEYQLRYAHCLTPAALQKKIVCILLEKECSIPDVFKIIEPIDLTDRNEYASNMGKLVGFFGNGTHEGGESRFTWFPDQPREIPSPSTSLPYILPSTPRLHKALPFQGFLSYTEDINVNLVKQLINDIEMTGVKLYVSDRDSIPGYGIFE